MPDNPERDIEKQLRASAEQRRARAGAPFELHEATRRSLQEEVARQYGQSKDHPGTTRAWWLVLWPRFAVGTTLAAVLGFGVWLALPPASQEETLAMGGAANEKDANSAQHQQATTLSPSTRPAELAEKAAQPALRLEPAPTLASSRDEAKKADATFKLGLGDKKLSRDLPPATAAATPARAPEALEVTSAKQKVGSESSLNLNEPALTLSGGSGGGGGGGFGGSAAPSRQTDPQLDLPEVSTVARKETNERATVSDRAQVAFADAGKATSELAADVRQEAARANQNAEPSTWYFRNQVVPPEGRAGGASGSRGAARALAPAAPVARAVLNSFRVEQTGDTLRIVDEDGSVYTGKLQTVAAEADRYAAKSFDSRQGEQARAARPTAEAKVADQLQQIAPVNFNVSGLNRSLSQQVVFTGQWQQAVLLNAVSNQTGAFFVATQAGVSAPQSNSAFTQSQLAPNRNLQQRVVGRARLEDARELRVDAVNVRP